MSRLTSPDIKRISVVIIGRVQGVGFRYFVRARALRNGLTGWVRNQQDGSVELEAQGAAEWLDDFMADIGNGPPLSYVRDVRRIDLPPDPGEEEFVIQ